MAIKFTIERNAFLAATSAAAKIVKSSVSETIPILGMAKLVASGTSLHITTTNLDLFVTTTVEADIEVPGEISASATGLARIANSCAEGSQIVFNSTQNETIAAKSGKARFRLDTLSADDFPNPQAIKDAQPCAMPAADLNFILNACETAISTEETRYYLNGINLSLKGDKAGDGGTLRACSTDGHRLTLAELPIDSDLAEAFAGLRGQTILPRNTVRHLRQMLPDDGMITVQVTDTMMAFSFGEYEIVTKLIDGSFPDFDRVIPKGYDKQQDIGRVAFSDLAGRIADCAPRDSKTRALRLILARDKLEISAGPAHDVLAADEFELDGPEAGFEVGFNARYLRDVLGITASDRVVMAYDNAVAPLLFTFPGEPRLTAVLMPLRV